MDGPESIMLRKINHQERQILYDLSYMGNLKKQTRNNPSPPLKPSTHTENILVAASGGGAKWVNGVKRYKLLVTK